MIKTVVKLLVAVAMLNAVARSALMAWDYYQPRDEALQLITLGAGTSTMDRLNRILIRAEALEVPLEPAHLDVSRDGGLTYVQAFYTQPVGVFPSYFYRVDLSFAVDAFAVDITR